MTEEVVEHVSTVGVDEGTVEDWMLKWRDERQARTKAGERLKALLYTISVFAKQVDRIAAWMVLPAKNQEELIIEGLEALTRVIRSQTDVENLITMNIIDPGWMTDEETFDRRENFKKASGGSSRDSVKVELDSLLEMTQPASEENYKEWDAMAKRYGYKTCEQYREHVREMFIDAVDHKHSHDMDDEACPDIEGCQNGEEQKPTTH